MGRSLLLPVNPAIARTERDLIRLRERLGVENGDWLRRLNNALRTKRPPATVPVPFFDGPPLRKKGTLAVAASFLLTQHRFAPRSQSPFSANPAQ